MRRATVARQVEAPGVLRGLGLPLRWRPLKRSRLALTGGLMLGAVILAAVLAPYLSGHNPTSQHLMSARLPPMWHAEGRVDHPLGTDFLGRDILSRILYGARVSLLTCLAAAVGAAVLGVFAGLIAGYYGGWLDTILMRLVDLQLAFPMIVLALALVAAMGPSLLNLVLALAFTGWMVYARVVRAVVMSLKAQEFVQSARALGASDVRILFWHIVPNTLTPVLVIFTLETARMILTESSLSFLGLGVPPPFPSWGRMLAESRLYLTVDYWVALFPGLAIMITVLGINFLGDGLRDILDPRLRHLL